MIVCSIDVGLLNLGLLFAEVNEDYSLDRVLMVEKVDMSQRCWDKDCEFKHAPCAANRILHLVKRFQTWFDRTRFVLMEHQPPDGMKDIEQVLYLTFWDKAFRISPNKMHAFFHIRHLDYDARKKATVERANKALEHLPAWHKLVRKHDVADAFCLMKVWLSDRQEKHLMKLKSTQRVVALGNRTAAEYLGQFVGPAPKRVRRSITFL